MSSSNKDPKAGFFDRVKNFYLSFSPYWRWITLYLVIIAFMVFLLFLIPSPTTPSLGKVGPRYELPKIRFPSSAEAFEKWRSFGKIKEEEEKESCPTIQDLLCEIMFESNLNETTVGDITCSKFENKCICIESLE